MPGQSKPGVFDRAASTFDRVGPGIFEHFGQQLVELTELSKDARVLDVGTGRGAALFPAAEAIGPGGSLVGVDLAEEMVRKTAEDLLRIPNMRHVQVQPMNAEELEFADDSFDFVLCALSLFLIEDPDQALGEMLRVVRRGGRVGVSTVAHGSGHFQWLMQLLSDFGVMDPPTDTPGSNTIQGMQQMLADAGFTDVVSLEKNRSFNYRDLEVLWESLWSHGARDFLERLSADELNAFREAVQERIRPFSGPQGIEPPPLSVVFAFGQKR